jgi:hypothetical protein
MPAEMLCVSISFGEGFSTNPVTSPSGRVRTSPYAEGSSTGVSASVPRAPRCSCSAIWAVTSRSVSTSPLSIRKRSSSSDSANFSAPPVPSGWGSST